MVVAPPGSRVPRNPTNQGSSKSREPTGSFVLVIFAESAASMDHPGRAVKDAPRLLSLVLT